MPASRFHRAKLRRAERASSTLGHGSINLVPLIDVLTSIVFFSLVSYQGLVAELTSFDLALPPMIITAESQPVAKADEQLNLLLAVRLRADQILIEHSAEGGFRREIPGLGPSSLDTLQQVMVDLHRQYPQNNDVLVIPSDDVSYNDVVHVLERLKLAEYPNVALGTRARTAPAVGGAAAAGGP